MAWNSPVATGNGTARNSLTTSSYSARAVSGAAAASNEGRRPLRTSPKSVNCETTSTAAPISATERSMGLPASPSYTRMSRILPATYFTSSGPSSRPMPRSTRRPRAISPVTRSPTRTRADVTRWTTARTSVADLNEVRGALVFELEGDAVAQLAARIQAGVEEVSRHDIAESLEHGLLHTGMFALEVENQPLDALALQAQIAARRAAAADDWQLALLGVQPRLVFTDVDQWADDDVFAAVRDESRRH